MNNNDVATVESNAAAYLQGHAGNAIASGESQDSLEVALDLTNQMADQHLGAAHTLIEAASQFQS